MTTNPTPTPNPFLLHRLPLTQPELAQQYGSTQQYIQRVEMGLSRHAPKSLAEYLEELRSLPPGTIYTEYHQYALAQRALLSPIKQELSGIFHNPKISSAEIIRRAAQTVRAFFRDPRKYTGGQIIDLGLSDTDLFLSEPMNDEMVLGQAMKLSTMTFMQWANSNSPNVPPNILAVLKEIPDWLSDVEDTPGAYYESGPYHVINLSNNTPQED